MFQFLHRFFFFFFLLLLTIKIPICAPFFHSSIRMLHIIHCSHSNTEEGKDKFRIRNSRGEERHVNKQKKQRQQEHGRIQETKRFQNADEMEEFSLGRSIITNKSLKLENTVQLGPFIFQASSRKTNDGIEKETIMLNLTHVDVVHYELNIRAHTDKG